MYNIVARDDDFSRSIEEKIKNALGEPKGKVKYVIAIGGDGTMLRAVHKFIDQIDDIIIFGIRSGHLGFFTDFSEDMLDDLIRGIMTEEFQITSFRLGSAHVQSKAGKETYYALNEFQILESNRVVVFDVKIDDELFETFRGNGLCLSTPAGSTGTNKSIGGAILDPNLDAMQLTEIAGINSNAYRTIGSPLIFSTERKLTLVPEEVQNLTIQFDHKQHVFEDVSQITFQLSKREVKIGYVQNVPFFERVRKSFL